MTAAPRAPTSSCSRDRVGDPGGDPRVAHAPTCPDWLPDRAASGHGVAEILAGYLELLQERLAKVPDHRQAVLLDMLGVSLLPAQGARTHVTMKAVPGTRGARVPPGHPDRGDRARPRRAGGVRDPRHGRDLAGVSGRGAQRDAVGRTPSRTTPPTSSASGPSRSSTSSTRGRARAVRRARRAARLRRTRRRRAGGRRRRPARPSRCRSSWSWWDGRQWRAFAAIAGSALRGRGRRLDRRHRRADPSGTIRLVAPCATAKPLELDGRTTHWVRGRLIVPLTSCRRERRPPAISRLRLAAGQRASAAARPASRRTRPGRDLAAIWWPEAPPGPSGPRTCSTTPTATAVRARERHHWAGRSSCWLPCPGTAVRVGVSLEESRQPDPPPPAPDPTIRDGSPVDSHDELTAPLLADPGIAHRRHGDPWPAAGQGDRRPARGGPVEDVRADRARRRCAAPPSCSPAPPPPTGPAAGSRSRSSGPITAAEEADELSGQSRRVSPGRASNWLDDVIGRLEGGTIVTGRWRPRSPRSTSRCPKLTGPGPGLSDLVRLGPPPGPAGADASCGRPPRSDHDVWAQVLAARQQLDAAISAADALPREHPTPGPASGPPRGTSAGVLVRRSPRRASVLAAGGAALDRRAAHRPGERDHRRHRLRCRHGRGRPGERALGNLLAGAGPVAARRRPLPSFLAMDPDDFVAEVHEPAAPPPEPT